MHCVCMQAYTRMACMHLCMHAWHEWIYACLMPCAPPYPHPQGGGIPTWMGPFCSKSYGPLHCPSHIPQGGGGEHHHHYTLTLGGGVGEPLDPGTYICIYIYMYIYFCTARRGAPWGGGRPPRGPGGGAARRGAWGGKGGEGGDRLESGHPQKTIQSPDKLNKAPKHYTNTHDIRQHLEQNMQNPKILNSNPKYQIRVTANINFT